MHLHFHNSSTFLWEFRGIRGVPSFSCCCQVTTTIWLRFDFDMTYRQRESWGGGLGGGLATEIVFLWLRDRRRSVFGVSLCREILLLYSAAAPAANNNRWTVIKRCCDIACTLYTRHVFEAERKHGSSIYIQARPAMWCVNCDMKIPKFHADEHFHYLLTSRRLLERRSCLFLS